MMYKRLHLFSRPLCASEQKNRSSRNYVLGIGEHPPIESEQPGMVQFSRL